MTRLREDVLVQGYTHLVVAYCSAVAHLGIGQVDCSLWDCDSLDDWAEECMDHRSERQGVSALRRLMRPSVDKAVLR